MYKLVMQGRASQIVHPQNYGPTPHATALGTMPFKSRNALSSRPYPIHKKNCDPSKSSSVRLRVD
jgi:hypothetical protein